MTRPAEQGDERFTNGFSDPEFVARYEEGVRQFVPALDALHRMAGLLLAECMKERPTVLVIGAGGGMELKSFADAYPDWRFVGVDPSGPMLELAQRKLQDAADRVTLLEGYVDDAPEGPFDGAVCLLTLHFMNAEDRLHALKQIRRRLSLGAPLVTAHSSFPQDDGQRARGLDRYERFAVASGALPELAEGARKSVDAALNIMTPEQDETIMFHAGFGDVETFYTAFTWRGWIGRAEGERKPQ
jgi:tRNA (cmo5U34)-methyltransferase